MLRVILSLATGLLAMSATCAFSISPGSSRSRMRQDQNNLSIRYMDNGLFKDIHEPIPDEHIPAVELKDKNGRTYEVGSIVRVVSANVKAFHVNKKGKGSFNDGKEFVPGGKSLQLPVGLQGVVTRVYDQSEVSAAFPIQVKFEPGKYVEEGYDAPVKFNMHLETYELEVVS